MLRRAGQELTRLGRGRFARLLWRRCLRLHTGRRGNVVCRGRNGGAILHHGPLRLLDALQILTFGVVTAHQFLMGGCRLPETVECLLTLEACGLLGLTLLKRPQTRCLSRSTGVGALRYRCRGCACTGNVRAGCCRSAAC